MLLSFSEWLKSQEESSAFTRARREIALGLRTPVGMGNVNSHSTAPAGIQAGVAKAIKKATKKKKKRK
jgi:hypothetical protein